MPIAPDVQSFTTGETGFTAVTPNPDVGRRYEVAINGVGLMMADAPQGSEYRRQSIPLEPQRLATTETPLTESIDRYIFFSQVDWSSGGGQRWFDRDTSPDKAAYWDSFGVDPFSERGKVKLLPATTEESAETYAGLRCTVVGDALYVQTAADTLKHSSTPGGGFTTLSGITDTTGAVTISDLTSDGQYWYAATGRSVIRGTTANPAADWSAQDAVAVQWAAGRICAAVKAGGSSTPNRFTTLTDTGTEERTNGHLTLDEGHTIVLGGSAGGFFYFGSYVGDKGSIWAWQLGLDSGGSQFYPFVAFDLPEGLIPISVGTAGGSVWIKAYRPSGASAGQTLLYEGLPDGQGALTVINVGELVEQGGTGDHSAGGDITGAGDLVLFPWPDMTGSVSGIGAVYLPSGGYAKWLAADNTGDVSSIVLWQGYPTFCVIGQGVFRESTSFVTTGWLESSIADSRASIQKVWDRAVVEAEPLAASQSIGLEWSTNKGLSFVSQGSLSGAGEQRTEIDMDVVSTSLGLKLTLNGPGTSTPKLTLTEVQYFGIGLADTVLQLPIDCSDHLRDLKGHPLSENGLGEGLARARWLESLTQTRVLVQDLDWHQTAESETWKIESVDTRGVTMYDSKLGAQTFKGLAVVTLRRAGA